MVDSIDSNSINSLRRIQELALSNLQANRKVAQTLINQTQQSSAVVKVNFNAVPQTKNLAFSAGSKTPPPRGSIVDKLV
jgi:hypothetical protein